MIRYLLYFLIFLPFERIKFGSLGEYNFKAILLILIAVLLFKKALVSNTLNFKLFIYTVSVVVLGYFLSAIVMRGEDIDSTILQLFGYAPLMISALIIFGRLKCIELDDLIKVLPIMIGMSGFLAIMIFYIYPDFMPSIYKEDELSIEWGRLPWINASNTLVALMIIMIAIVKRKDTYIIYISTGFALLATMRTCSRG